MNLFFPKFYHVNSTNIITKLDRDHAGQASYECIEKYMKISSDIFQNKRSSVNVVGRMQDLWKAEGKFDSDEMIRQFKDAAEERLGDQDAPLKEKKHSGSCKV